MFNLIPLRLHKETTLVAGDSVTQKGYVGMVPAWSEVGDVVCILRVVLFLSSSGAANSRSLLQPCGRVLYSRFGGGPSSAATWFWLSGLVLVLVTEK